MTRTEAQDILFNVLRECPKYKRIIQEFAENSEPQEDGSMSVDAEGLKEAFGEVFFDDLLNDFVSDAESDVVDAAKEMNEASNESFAHLCARE